SPTTGRREPRSSSRRGRARTRTAASLFASTRERSPTGRRSITSTDGGPRRASVGWQRRLLEETLERLEVGALRGANELEQRLLAGRRQHAGGSHLLPGRGDVARTS